jgi:hypothetical protein
MTPFCIVLNNSFAGQLLNFSSTAHKKNSYFFVVLEVVEIFKDLYSSAFRPGCPERIEFTCTHLS